jgi:hypothetical protein
VLLTRIEEEEALISTTLSYVNYAPAGLYKGKVQSIFTGYYILPSADDKKKDQRIKGKGTNKKREKKRRSYLSRSTAYLVLDSGA